MLFNVLFIKITGSFQKFFFWKGYYLNIETNYKQKRNDSFNEIQIWIYCMLCDMARHPGQISSNIVRSFVHKVKSFDSEVQIL